MNGSQNETHYGVDIGAEEEDEIIAPAAGVVWMAEELYLSGNTIVLDHGHGVSTSYLYMAKFEVKPGAVIVRGGRLPVPVGYPDAPPGRSYAGVSIGFKPRSMSRSLPAAAPR